MPAAVKRTEEALERACVCRDGLVLSGEILGTYDSTVLHYRLHYGVVTP